MIRMIRMIRATSFCLAFVAAFHAFASEAQAQFGLDTQPEADPLVRIDATFATKAVVPGSTQFLGVRFRIAPKWHIYWSNPGDSGSEPRINLDLPEGFKAGPIVWPRPVVHTTEWETTFGYHGETMLFIPVTAPAIIKDPSVRIGVKAEWLVCDQMCLMGAGTTSIELPVAKAGESVSSLKDDPRSAFAKGLACIPVPFQKATGTIARLEMADGRMALEVTGPTGGSEKIVFVPDLTPGVASLGGATTPATISGDRYRILVPLEVNPDNALGKPLEVAGVVLFGNERQDPAVSIRLPIKP